MIFVMFFNAIESRPWSTTEEQTIGDVASLIKTQSSLIKTGSVGRPLVRSFGIGPPRQSPRVHPKISECRLRVGDGRGQLAASLVIALRSSPFVHWGTATFVVNLSYQFITLFTSIKPRLRSGGGDELYPDLINQSSSKVKHV